MLPIDINGDILKFIVAEVVPAPVTVRLFPIPFKLLNANSPIVLFLTKAK